MSDLSANFNSYLKTPSATIVAVIKLLESIAAGIGLFFVLFFLFANIHSLAALPEMWNQIFKGTEIVGDAMSSYIVPMLQSGGMFAICLSLVLVGTVVLSLIFILLDGVCLMTLRFSYRGAGAVRVIHLIRFVLGFIDLVVFVVFIIWFCIASGNVANIAGYSGAPLIILTCIFSVIVVAILLLDICYEKDIAKAMQTVKYETRTGMEDKWFKRTHLSGISFIFGILSCLALALLAYNVLHDPEPTSMIAQAIGILLLVLKYFAVSFCYRNLKHAR